MDDDSRASVDVEEYDWNDRPFIDQGGPRYVSVPVAILEDDRIDDEALRAYLVLLKHMDTHDRSIKDMAELAGLKASAFISRPLRDLAKTGWITRRGMWLVIESAAQR